VAGLFITLFRKNGSFHPVKSNQRPVKGNNKRSRDSLDDSQKQALLLRVVPIRCSSSGLAADVRSGGPIENLPPTWTYGDTLSASSFSI